MGVRIHLYKMLTGNELIRYPTKYRPKEHQKLPSKKPLVAIFDELIRRYVRRKLNTLRSYYFELSIYSIMLLIISSDLIETIHHG